jgi:protein-disulfide isomerase
MKFREYFWNGLTLAAVACAIVATTGAYRRGTLFSRGGEAVAEPSRPVAEWPTLLTTGRRIGPANAALTIIEFADFECPACARFASVLDTVRQRHPNDFAVVFHHFPLSYHRLAYPLARAAECAAGQDRFAQFHDLAYKRRDSLDVAGMTGLGRLAGVRDSAAFANCIGDTSRVPAIERGIATARRIGARGTPTIIMDSLLLAGRPPTAQEFDELIAKRKKSVRP